MNNLVSVILGTRPEAIKLAPVIKAFQSDPALRCSVCVTGQHRELIDPILTAFSIEPDADLGLMLPGQSLPKFTGRALSAIGEYLTACRPGLVMVQGDTSSVLAAALAAFYSHIPVAHVEAGLRTFNINSPWPEEANRVLATKLATLHFAPTLTNRENLLREGVDDSFIFVTGNTVIDALKLARDRLDRCPIEVPGISGNILQGRNGERIVLVTGHRRENQGDGLENICGAISRLAASFSNVHFVYPVHLNPAVQGTVRAMLGGVEGRANIHLFKPLEYLEFVALMKSACLILTDSGGVQEEAPSLGVPVLVTRDTTERPEAVVEGRVKIVGSSAERIFDEASLLLSDESARAVMARPSDVYGDGQAAIRIAARCHGFLKNQT